MSVVGSCAVASVSPRHSASLEAVLGAGTRTGGGGCERAGDGCDRLQRKGGGGNAKKMNK